MGRYFTHLFGRTSCFGVDVDLYTPESQKEDEFDFPHWGKLKIWVTGKNLTASSGPQGEFSDSVDWEMAPLLEWLTNNWSPIFHEEKLPLPSGGTDGANALTTFWRSLDFGFDGMDIILEKRTRIHDWWSRHSIRAASEGGLFPEIIIRRLSDDIEISWDSHDPIPGNDRTYVDNAGSAILPIEEVRDVLLTFLDNTLHALLEQNPSDKHLQDISSMIPALSDQSHRDENFLWLSGLMDTPAEDTGMEFLESIASIKGILMHDAVTLLFRSASPKINSEDIIEIKRILNESGSNESTDIPLRQYIRKKALDPLIPPYKQGYDLASSFRTDIGLDDSEPFDSDNILDELKINVMDATLSDNTLRALSFRSRRYPPSMALNRKTIYYEYRHAREMDKAHELCHLLYDQDYGHPMGIISGPWAPLNLEKRANAFAAYLRLPFGGIRDVIGRDPPARIDISTLKRLMEKYCVGITTATYQLLNLGWISDLERQDLIDTYGVHELGR